MTLVPLNPARLNNFWYARGGHPTVIVFVHGIFSNSRSCWLTTASAKPIFWPDLILSDPRVPDPSIFLAGYETDLDAGDFPVSQCARDIMDALRRPEIDGTRPALESN